LYGLAGTDVARDAWLAEPRVPVARLRGKKKFAITAPTSRPHFCSTGVYPQCSESGALTMRLTFTPHR
jgi:hypothetical protein